MLYSATLNEIYFFLSIKLCCMKVIEANHFTGNTMLKLKYPLRLVGQVFPIVRWSRNYDLRTGIGDLIAGITIALTLIPQSIAYASLAGFEPQVHVTNFEQFAWKYSVILRQKVRRNKWVNIIWNLKYFLVLLLNLNCYWILH